MNIDDKGNGEIIHLEHIQKSYYIGAEKVSVLRDIQLSVHQGEFISIMGPSGAGKSTLMNILGCLDRPTEGSYVLDGSEVSNLDDNQLAVIRNRKIAFFIITFFPSSFEISSAITG